MKVHLTDRLTPEKAFATREMAIQYLLEVYKYHPFYKDLDDWKKRAYAEDQVYSLEVIGVAEYDFNDIPLNLSDNTSSNNED